MKKTITCFADHKQKNKSKTILLLAPGKRNAPCRDTLKLGLRAQIRNIFLQADYRVGEEDMAKTRHVLAQLPELGASA